MVESKNQYCPLPEDYPFIREDRPFRLWVGFLYGLTKIVGFLYCQAGLHLRFQNRRILKVYQDRGIFLFANHTQEFGDVVCPEAHVWPDYTSIRPFPATSFRFPIEEGAPSFAMTTTYQKRRFGRRPKVTVFQDRPFFPAEGLTSRKEKQEDLCRQIHDCMVRRSTQSNCQYIRYEVSTPLSSE